ncbi:hypothetical protein C0993_002396 [Termitomyces sp. T159_Od127]|nr:hypothetical protein C0993_002396 [Termitomyces sp. T159_Od127]
MADETRFTDSCSGPEVYDGGLVVTREMRKILEKPGFITLAKGGQRLRNLYVDQSASFDARKLSSFGFACFVGCLPWVQKHLNEGTAPKLDGTETTYEFGYATLIISGAQRVQPSERTDHVATLRFLVSQGLPVDVPDIAGLTALHHCVIGQILNVELLRELLKSGANVDHQNRYGEVPLFGAYMKSHVQAVELLLQHGADLGIKEADGLAPSDCLQFGPQITAVVQKWIRKRNGQEAPRNEKRCDSCGASDKPLKNCAKCHVARYCSVECQRKEWSTHREMCQPFSAGNTVTVKPFYVQGENTMPTEVLRNRFFGVNDTTPQTHYRSGHVPKHLNEAKNMVVKVQLPYNLMRSKPEIGAGPLFVYTKKRDFVCRIRREDGAASYNRISNVVAEKGVGGGKAYFAAELKTKDELVIKVSEVLAEQPF